MTFTMARRLHVGHKLLLLPTNLNPRFLNLYLMVSG